MPCFGCPGLSGAARGDHSIAISGDVADPSVVPRIFFECEFFCYFVVYHVYQKTVYFRVHGIKFVVCDKLTNISKFSSFSCATDLSHRRACLPRIVTPFDPDASLAYVQKLSQLLVPFLK
jgi:hypothetical protein